MGLATVERELLHTRRVELRGYKRKDGLYDIEGHLVDTKTYDRVSHGVTRSAGDPIHEMSLCLTVSTAFLIVGARAESTVVPYAGFCERVAPDYRKLIGMTISAGFMREVRGLFGGANGCSHLTELIGAVATAAFQTMSEEINASTDRQPFQLDGCHALRTEGDAVRLFYPKWYRGPHLQTAG
ncbi:hypothetical protein AWB81_02966 [Caballeronia arationis]|jgi:hypothetical protein|uniref:DUF2889 domain-containing protein n=1 Tax=Caballeronia arationis TaxID=1777142 RepID=A0A7Z7I5T2_9BURK|nr:DUF2889 domain-containing protein [Caballeronia arationis]SAK69270.1 hypothetical protein AWB81_02966 [Caballeronia arationis]SOE64870.1 Protein of unknown function [Caballeronia arationis]